MILSSRALARGSAQVANTMLMFLGKRLLQLLPTLFFVSLIIFSLQQLLPGDPALAMAGEERDPAVLEQIRRQYRLDQPLYVQYVYWVGGVLSGDLGESMRLKEPVLTLIAQKFPVTLQLALMAILISLLIGVSAGVISAVKKNTAIDYAVNLFALWGISTPNFWLGIMPTLAGVVLGLSLGRAPFLSNMRCAGSPTPPRTSRSGADWSRSNRQAWRARPAGEGRRPQYPDVFQLIEGQIFGAALHRLVPGR